jgi:Tfp pilus assembly protein PilP
MHTVWDGVRVSGIVRGNGYTAIVEAQGRSFIVHPGDSIANTFRVVAIGPDSVTLATDKEERHLTLGG